MLLLFPPLVLKVQAGTRRSHPLSLLSFRVGEPVIADIGHEITARRTMPVAPRAPPVSRHLHACSSVALDVVNQRGNTSEQLCPSSVCFPHT